MPDVLVIGGPNGAGKTTVAPTLLRDLLRIREFVNADQIAAGLSAFNSEATTFQAGRIMLERVRDLGHRRVDFAFETTLSSRSFVPFLRKLKAEGYTFRLVYLWLKSAKQARERIAQRVRAGGHGIPARVVNRRYHRSIANFFSLYQNLADEWRFYDNSRTRDPRLVAAGGRSEVAQVVDPALWRAIQRRYAGHGQTDEPD